MLLLIIIWAVSGVATLLYVNRKEYPHDDLVFADALAIVCFGIIGGLIFTSALLFCWSFNYFCHNLQHLKKVLDK